MASNQPLVPTPEAACTAAALPGFPEDALLRPAVLLRRIPEAASGRLVVLRFETDARVLLGALIDRDDRIHRWLEIWIQPPPPDDGSVDRAAWDRGWTDRIKARRAAAPESWPATSWESQTPPALTVRWADGSSPEWREGSGTAEAGDDGTVFTDGSSRLALRWLAPLALGAWSGLMRGRAWKGLGMGKQPIVPAGGWEVLADPEAVRHGVGLVFGARGGAAARLAETFHLRLLMARQLVQRVEAAVRLAKAPFLDLTPSAFRVGLGRLGTGLPGLWTAHVELAGWPAAVRLPGLSAEGGGGYRHPVKLSSSVYRLDASIQHRSAVGSVRLRSLDETGGGRHALEGTLAAGEALKAAPGNLLRVVLPVAGQPLPVVARVSPAEGLGPGEVRFRSVETTFAANQATALKELLGVSIDEVQADLLPEIGPACDLFSLGVIVAEFFLVSDGNTLAEAMDECRSLAAALAEAGVDAAGAAAAVRRMAGEDARWEKALGPARLLDGGETAGASRAIAGSLWWGLVAWIVRTIPGAGPASFRRGPGDAPPTRPAAVFEEPLKELDRLCALSAAAVFPEPAADAELRELVRRFRD